MSVPREHRNADLAGGSKPLLVAKSCPTPLPLNGPAKAFLPRDFSRQECWSGLPFPSPRHLPDPEMEPASPALQVDSLPLSHLRSPAANPPAPNNPEKGEGISLPEVKVSGYLFPVHRFQFNWLKEQ